MSRRLTQDEFLANIKAIYGDDYDYSDVNYVKSSEPVTLICKKHGRFVKCAATVARGHGCPECGRENKIIHMKASATKEDYAARAEKRKKTLLDKYGVDNPMKCESVKENLRQIMLDRYGVDNPRKLDSVVDKARQTNLERYGAISYAQTEEGLKRIQATNMERYGEDNFMKSDARFAVLDEMKEKSRQTQLERYGAEHYSKSDAFRSHLSERKKKELKTKLENNTFNTSEPELKLKELLISAFGEDDIKCQYFSDKYPFRCDFYVVSLDLYVELNAFWAHGFQWFDDTKAECVSQLQFWEKMAIMNEYYLNSIHTWTVRDVEKRKIAKQNNLNYVVFWDASLRDAVIWFQMGCPLGHDWDKMYSWLCDRDLTICKSHKLMDTVQSFKSVAKQYQWNVFYEKEIEMWHLNSIKNNLSLQMYLYFNRFQHLHKLPYELTNDEVLRAFKISGLHYSHSSFDVSMMDNVIKKYGITSVYDPCAGWGERILYCYKNDITYYGIDINKKLECGYKRMIQDFGMKNQSVFFGDSSTCFISGDVDAVITCPPYGSLEHYTNEGAENLSDKDFMNWWKCVVMNSLNMHPTYFCFQINQTWHDKMIEVVKDCGFEVVDEFKQEIYRSHFARKSNCSKKYESMVVLRRL